jgi:RNA 2',3'-cyclic 3'-phosphodiesterase
LIAASRTQQGYLSYTIISRACIDLTDENRLCILPSQYSMTHLRAFLAVELTAEIHAKLEKIKKELAVSESGTVRWVSTHNIHLTLKFLGEIPDSDVERINTLLAPCLRNINPFTVNLSGLGAFPNLQRPRVLWVGFQPSTDLAALQVAIDDCLLKLKYTKEERSFHPHLTLGRVSDHVNPREVDKITQRMKEGKIETSGEIPVDRVQLFRSDLKPSGPVYSSIHSWLMA